MKKFACGIFFIFLQTSVFVFGHYLQLSGIYDTINKCFVELGDLENFKRYSNSQDEAGVCYGTYGAATGQTGPFQTFPRCYSEFYLLKQIKESIPNLNNFKISIINESFLPCKLRRGQSKFNGQELNPGIPCDEYLNNFAQGNDRRISVKVFGNIGGVEYPK